MVGAAHLGDDRPDGGVVVAVAVDAGGRLDVAGLKDLVRLVVAVARVDRAEDRQLVEERRLLGQVLADEGARQARGDYAERTAVLVGAVGLGVPGIDVAGPAGHPEEDDALGVSGTAAGFSRFAAGAEQGGEGEPGQAGQPGLEHAAAAAHRKPFAPARVQAGKRMQAMLGMR